MSRGTRVFLILAVGAVVLSILVVGAAAAAVRQAGAIAVDVRDRDGGQLAIRLPAAAARLAIAVAPSALLADAAREVRPWLPATREAWRALEQAGDFVLVEVEGRDEQVRIAKRGGQVQILVADAGGTRCEIAVPLATLRAVLDKLALV